MALPISPPYPPMEALLVEEIPRGEVWQYEPKWDGFRCLVFRDGPDIFLQSKAGQPLARYFPELVEAVARVKSPRFVLDGEIVIPVDGAFSFDDLLLRLHPAASRVQKLAGKSPAILIVFDLLVDEPGTALINLALRERRKRLEGFARKYFAGADRIKLSPATMDPKVAEGWFKTAGPSLDGTIAKRVDVEYRSGDRTGMQKIKKLRTADCVVGGFRYGSKQPLVGSLLLGLYDEQGLLHHVGFTSGIKAPDRKPLTKKLQALIKPPGFTGRAPGGPSRWSTERSGEWEPLDPQLVAEVRYDHFTGGRFRHGTRFLRWRPDKAPKSCGFDQILSKAGQPLKLFEERPA